MAQPITLPAVTGSLSGQAGTLRGWSVRETSGAAAARFRLFDGSSTGGQLICDVALAAGGSTVIWLGDEGVVLGAGLFYSLDAGALSGAAWYVPRSYGPSPA